MYYPAVLVLDLWVGTKKAKNHSRHKDLFQKWWKNNSQSFYKNNTTIQDKKETIKTGQRAFSKTTYGKLNNIPILIWAKRLQY